MAAIPSSRKRVRPDQYHERPPLLAGYYTYWSGLPIDGRFETYIRAHRGFAAAPTHDGLTLTVGGWPYAEFEANKKDVEGHFLKMFDLAPEFAERIRGAKREAPFAGAAVPNFFRKPYGPGWALVGDAGYNKDPITAQGITDAFRDAELCATALDQTFSGARAFDDAMGDYQRRATSTRCRCTNSRASWRRWNRRRLTCSSCSARSTATRRPWTALSR